MNELRTWILGRLERGETVVLAAVTHTSGSTARGTDALLAMDSKGAMAGTVGGGFSEGQTIDAARQFFVPEGASSHTGQIARDLEFDLTPETNNTQMICGGRLSVHLEKIEPRGSAAQALRAGFDHVENGAPCAFATMGTSRGRHYLTVGDEKRILFPQTPAQGEKKVLDALLATLEVARPGFGGAADFALEAGNDPELKAVRVFWLGMAPDPVVYIFGAGHVGVATCDGANLAGFKVVVTDDRPELLTGERFPRASLLRAIETSNARSRRRKTPAIDIGPQDCALILTRQPDIDKEMLAQLLRTDAGYIGLIGSKTKRAGIYAALRNEGLPTPTFRASTRRSGSPSAREPPKRSRCGIVAEIIAVRAGVLPNSVIPDAETVPKKAAR
jgi:xanthine dehydrogenase accessory factor